MITVYNLDAHPTADFRAFVDLQGDLKTYHATAKLAARIQAAGFKYDFLCWQSDAPCEHAGQTYPAGTRFIIDAHSRQRALALLAEQGETIPPVPYTRIQAANLLEAQQELLFLNSRYGRIQPESDMLADILETFDPADLDLIDVPELLPPLDEEDGRDVVQLIDDPDCEAETQAVSAPRSIYPVTLFFSQTDYDRWQAAKAQAGVKDDTVFALRGLD